MVEELAQMKIQLSELCEAVNRLSHFMRTVADSVLSVESKLDLLLMKILEQQKESFGLDENLTAVPRKDDESHSKTDSSTLSTGGSQKVRKESKAKPFTSCHLTRRNQQGDQECGVSLDSELLSTALQTNSSFLSSAPNLGRCQVSESHLARLSKVRKTLDAKDSKDLTCLQLDQTAAKYQRSPLSASKSTPDLTAEVSLSELESPFIPNPRSVSTLCSKGCGVSLSTPACKRRHNKREMEKLRKEHRKVVESSLGSAKSEQTTTHETKKVSCESGVFSSDEISSDDNEYGLRKKAASEAEEIPEGSPSGEALRGGDELVAGDEKQCTSELGRHNPTGRASVRFDERQAQMPNHAGFEACRDVTIEANNDKISNCAKRACDVKIDEELRQSKAPGANAEDNLTVAAAADLHDANGTLIQPCRRASCAGVTLKHENEQNIAITDVVEKPAFPLPSDFIRPRSSCDLVTYSQTKSDLGSGVARSRMIDHMKRQFSNSSTNSAPGGIHIRLGGDSDSEDDDAEVKLPDIPPPKFSHRSVTVKNSTYKHFYELKEPIGGGRFGRVYRCMEKKTGLQLAAKCFVCKKPVAKTLNNSKSLKMNKLNLKTKRTQQEPVEKNDVLMEIAIMNQIDHENIVKLYDAYQNDNTMTLILEYLSGGELFERVLADRAQLTELDAVLFMRQITKAIQYLHKTLILHLDLKPENILCLDRSTHHLKIIDFGLARKYVPRQKLVVQWGTPEFMAPEIVNYENVSFSSDMWSVGVICYILLSGISPFLGDTDAETMDNIAECAWDFEEDQFKKVSEEAKDFISRLLVSEKSGRMSAAQCLRHEWLSTPLTNKRRKALTNKTQLKDFMARIHWKASITAIRAANWLRNKVPSGSDSDSGSTA